MDATENERRVMTQEINANATDREKLEAKHGKVWDTAEMQRDFEVTGFAAPFVVVNRKSDGKRGALEFQHSPRFYYDFQEG
jgi:hypothetical protein